MSKSVATVTNPRNQPLMATTDGLLVGGGQTVEVDADLLLPDINHTGLIYTIEKPVKPVKVAKPEETLGEVEAEES